MSEELPEENEELNKTPTEVTFTEEELNTLSNANPGDAGLEDVLAAHGLKFNQDVVVHVEGRPDAVYTTSEEDFMTRDKTASEEWNASVGAAQGMIDLETVMQAPSLAEQDLSPEREAEIEHLQEEMGEVALDDADIIDPEEANTEVEESADKAQLEQSIVKARLQYDNLTRIVRESTVEAIGKGSGKLEESSLSIGVAYRALESLEDDKSTLRRIANGVESGDFDDGRTRFLLDEVLQNLQTAHSRLRAVGEGGIPDTRRTLTTLNSSIGEAQFEFRRTDGTHDAHIAEIVQANPAMDLEVKEVSSEAEVASIKALESPLDDLLKAAGGVESEAEEATQTLRRMIGEIEDIKNSTYSGRVNVGDIQALPRRITALLENTKQLGSFGRKVNDTVSTMKVASSKLRAE